jgi:hypothetical protein
MTSKVAVWVFLVLISFSSIALGQTSSAIDAHALVATADSVMAGHAAIEDVTLTGKATRIAGSDKENGTVTLKARASGEARIDLDFPSGPRGEVLSFSEAVPRAVWSGPDQKQHFVSFHNALVDAGWFAPLLVLGRIKAGTHGLKVTSAESLTRDGQLLDVLHVAMPIPGPNASKHPAWIAQLLQQAGQFDLYFDSATLLPSEMDFNGHPDDNVRQDLPVRVRYSDYRVAGGIRVPFRIRKYVNNTLVLDLRLETAAFNNGLNASVFNVQ